MARYIDHQRKVMRKRKRREKQKVKRKRREQLLDGAALMGIDLMHEMIKMIHARKLSHQEIAVRVVDMMEAQKRGQERATT